jgi:hypothetical protein
LILIDELSCNGRERDISECKIVEKKICTRSNLGVAGVQCTHCNKNSFVAFYFLNRFFYLNLINKYKALPDLYVDVELLRRDMYLEDRVLYSLQCAMEELCLQPDAYRTAEKPSKNEY